MKLSIIGACAFFAAFSIFSVKVKKDIAPREAFESFSGGLSHGDRSPDFELTAPDGTPYRLEDEVTGLDGGSRNRGLRQELPLTTDPKVGPSRRRPRPERRASRRESFIPITRCIGRSSPRTRSTPLRRCSLVFSRREIVIK